MSDTLDFVTTSGKTASFTGLSAAALNADLLAPIDVSQYATISMTIHAIGGANFVQFAHSNDGTNWTAYMTVGSGGNFIFARRGRYFKATVTTWVSGTVTGSSSMFADPINNAVHRLAFPFPDSVTPVGMQDSSSNLTQLYSYSAITDGVTGNRAAAVGRVAFDGTNISRERVITFAKPVSATASGDTAVWTPTSGKKFRLLGYQIVLSWNASLASTGTLTIKLRDATTADLGVTYQVPLTATAATTSGAPLLNTGFISLGALGLPSGAINRALNVNLSAALATGSVQVIAFGNEE